MLAVPVLRPKRPGCRSWRIGWPCCSSEATLESIFGRHHYSGPLMGTCWLVRAHEAPLNCWPLHAEGAVGPDFFFSTVNVTAA
jgi:hypothetical protein